MNTQNAAPVSPAERWGYASGMLLKRGYWRLKALESRLAERAQGAGVPGGRQLVRGGFLLAGLAVLGMVLFLSFWILLSLLSLFILYRVIINHRFNDSKDVYWYQAYGDPHGEYELKRTPGQPDLDE